MRNTKNPKAPIMKRKGEESTPPKRNTRFFKQGPYWYYSTREGINIGPFDTPQKAESGISDFIDFILNAEPQVVDSLNKYRPAA